MKTGPYLKSVHDALPERGRPFLSRALAGDALAARRLMLIAPARLRAHIASLAYHLKTPNPAYREIVKAVWTRESRHLLTDFWPKRTIRKMLARADFPVPAFGGPLTVFRPVCGVPVRKAAAGLSWVLSREQALRRAAAAHAASPCILRATLDPQDVIYFASSRGMQEVVSRRPVRQVVVDSAPPLSREPMRLAQGAGGR